jgi:hypothetical protein
VEDLPGGLKPAMFGTPDRGGIGVTHNRPRVKAPADWQDVIKKLYAAAAIAQTVLEAD